MVMELDKKLSKTKHDITKSKFLKAIKPLTY